MPDVGDENNPMKRSVSIMVTLPCLKSAHQNRTILPDYCCHYLLVVACCHHYGSTAARQEEHRQRIVLGKATDTDRQYDAAMTRYVVTSTVTDSA